MSSKMKHARCSSTGLHSIMLYFAILIFSFGLVKSSPVVGGTDAAENEFPYLVSLRDETNDQFCGGGIIAQDYIISAYHCLKGVHLKNIRVVAGTSSQTKKDAKYVLKVKRVYRFNNKKWLRASSKAHDDRHDLMLLKLDGKIPLSDKAKILKLPTTKLANGTKIAFAGWGVTNKKTDPDMLQKLGTTIQPVEKCKEAVDKEIGFFPPYETCTFAEKGKGLCSGDSGTPLIKDGTLVGVALWVASTEDSNCATGVPDFIANIYYYTDFIQSHLKDIDKIYKAKPSDEYIEIADFFKE